MIYKQWKIEHNSEKIRIKPIKKNIFVQKPWLKKEGKQINCTFTKYKKTIQNGNIMLWVYKF